MAIKTGLIKYLSKPLRLVWLVLLVAITAIISAERENVHAQSPLQLDEGCTITLGNQTGNVRPDGTFFVRNIALLRVGNNIVPQLYRVRATCLRDGQAITGQSDFFSLRQNQTFFVVDVFPVEIDPIPLKISITTFDDFVSFGEALQLKVKSL